MSGCETGYPRAVYNLAIQAVVQPSFWDRLRFWNGNEPPCDVNYNVNRLLADWLKSDPSNRLFILAGKPTIDKESGHDFGGIWKESGRTTLPTSGISRSPAQAFVCYYENKSTHAGMGHEDIVRNFYSLVESPKASCPTAPSGYSRSEWHP